MKRLRIHIAILEELVDVGGIRVDGIEHRIAKEDSVAAGTVEINAAISLVNSLAVDAEILEIVTDARKVRHSENLGGIDGRGCRVPACSVGITTLFLGKRASR